MTNTWPGPFGILETAGYRTDRAANRGNIANITVSFFYTYEINCCDPVRRAQLYSSFAAEM